MPGSKAKCSKQASSTSSGPTKSNENNEGRFLFIFHIHYTITFYCQVQAHSASLSEQAGPGCNFMTREDVMKIKSE